MFLPNDFAPPCTAPFIAFLVDPDKTVRPCCVWQGTPLGDLKKQTIHEVLQGEPWQQLKESMLRGVLPEGCKNCKYREDHTGRSIRKQFAKGGKFFVPDWNSGDTYQIEYNASNVCNLGCIHCNGRFSTGTFRQDEALSKVGLERPKNDVHPPNEKIVHDILSTANEKTQRLFFKGGEPMLNSDVALILEELDKRGYLPNITVLIVTNGTHTETPTAKKVRELASKARRICFMLSVDGVGDVQDYIRYGNSSIANIEKFISTFSSYDNVQMSLLTSVMACNVFYLRELADWWRSLDYPRLRHEYEFSLFVLLPKWLSFSSLLEETRLRLADEYESYQNNVFSYVINNLRNTRSNEVDRRQLKKFLKTIDDLRGTDYRKSLPALAEELA